MSRTRSGPRRLKGGLPAGWKFLHKTGTGQDYKGSTAGYNDIGIATAPDGTRYANVVLLGDTSTSVPARTELMQAVSGSVADYHRRKGPMKLALLQPLALAPRLAGCSAPRPPLLSRPTPPRTPHDMTPALQER